MTTNVLRILTLLALVGLASAIASLYVHVQMARQAGYLSFCDVSATISCTQVYQSPYAYLLGVPVALLGLLLCGQPVEDPQARFQRPADAGAPLKGANSFTGGVSILGGTVRIGSLPGLPTNSVVTLADVSGATLDLNNINQSLASIRGGGASGGNVSLGSGNLTLDPATSSSNYYAGVISGSVTVRKANNGPAPTTLPFQAVSRRRIQGSWTEPISASISSSISGTGRALTGKKAESSPTSASG